MEQYVKVVNYSSGSELSSAMVGGHININITGADEIMGLIQSGDIVPPDLHLPKIACPPCPIWSAPASWASTPTLVPGAASSVVPIRPMPP